MLSEIEGENKASLLLKLAAVQVLSVFAAKSNKDGRLKFDLLAFRKELDDNIFKKMPFSGLYLSKY